MKTKRSKRTKKLIQRQRAMERRLATTGSALLNAYAIAKKSAIHGIGVFAASEIKRNIPIIEYVGEKISKSEAERRTEDGRKIFIFNLNLRIDIDGSVGGNGSHLINHGCQPNAEAHDSGNQIWIVAIRDIREGEEIIYDYGFDEEDYQDYPCRCAAPNCRGYIIDEAIWERIQRREIK